MIILRSLSADPEIGGDPEPGESLTCSRLKTSESLRAQSFYKLLSHVSDSKRHELSEPLPTFQSLFGTVLSRANVIEHDTDVGDTPLN